MRSFRKPLLLLLPLAFVLASGCSKVQARIELKEGNRLYEAEDYKKALDQFQKGLRLDPGFKPAWRSVGLSAMALYRPGDKSPENLKLASTAIEAFEKYLAAFPRDEKVREYLLTTLLNSERYDEALARLQNILREKPGDADATKAYATILMKAGRLTESLQYIRRQPKPDPELFHGIAAICWDKGYRDPSLSPVQRAEFVAMGLEAEGDALKIKPDYFEANVYYGLLLRVKANMEPDLEKAALIVEEAKVYQEKAKAIRQAQLEKEKKAREAAEKAAAQAPAAR